MGTHAFRIARAMVEGQTQEPLTRSIALRIGEHHEIAQLVHWEGEMNEGRRKGANVPWGIKCDHGPARTMRSNPRHSTHPSFTKSIASARAWSTSKRYSSDTSSAGGM